MTNKITNKQTEEVAPDSSLGNLIALVDERLRRGLGSKEIQAELGLASYVVARVARLTPTERRTKAAKVPGENPFSRARLEWAKPNLERLNGLGYQMSAAAGELGINEKSARYYCHRLGIVWRNTNGRTVYRFEKSGWLPLVKAWKDAGKSNDDIRDLLEKAVGYKMSLSSVQRFVLNSGLRPCRTDSSR
jgi:hypothetical protein